MKKIVSFILALAISLAAVPAFAKADDMEKVLSSVKDRIDSTDKFEEFDTSVWDDENGIRYCFNWYSNSESYESMNVVADIDGIITDYGYYEDIDYSDRKPKLNKADSDEAYEIAAEFVKRINPQLASHLRVEKADDFGTFSSDSLYFRLIRCENGIDVANNAGSVNVSTDTKKVCSYSLNYEEFSFDKPDNIISLEEAKKAFAEKIGIELQYDYEYKDGELTAYPVYASNEKYLEYIDAKTGEVTNLIEEEYNFERAEESAANYDMVADKAGGFTDIEVKELEGVSNLLSKEEIEKQLRANKVLNVPATYKLKSLYGSKDDDKYLYTLRFANAKNSEDILVTANAQTGAVTYFYKSQPSGNGKVKKDRARQIADDVAKALAFDHFSEFVLEEDSENYTFEYTRYVNGIPFNGNKIYVEIDSTNGNAKWFDYGYDDIEFPSIDNVISKEEALEKFFEANEYKPYYVLSCSKKGLTKADKTTLVYKFDDNKVTSEIDAITGKVKKYYWESEDYTDIEGHYSEKAVNSLKENGIGYTGNKFLPSQEITQKEVITFLVSVLKQSSSILISDDMDYKYYENSARRYGIIDDTYSPDAPVTRGNVSLLFAKAMGFNEYAQIEGIYKCPFADVTENIGQITILSGLKVINGDGLGNFNPNKTLTRADFAIILYNCLSR